VRGYGFGPLEPNTIVIGETEKAEQVEAFTRFMSLSHHLNKNVIMVREGNQVEELPDQPRIDIWWRGKQANIGLMITLAYQLSKGGRWKNARIVMKRLIANESERTEIHTYLKEFKREHRLKLELEILVMESTNPLEMIHRSSKDASLVVMGMKKPDSDSPPDDYIDYYRNMLRDTEGLPLVLVLSAGNVDFSEIIGIG
jgi:hypothetical protein